MTWQYKEPGHQQPWHWPGFHRIFQFQHQEAGTHLSGMFTWATTSHVTGMQNNRNIVTFTIVTGMHNDQNIVTFTIVRLFAADAWLLRVCLNIALQQNSIESILSHDSACYKWLTFNNTDLKEKKQLQELHAGVERNSCLPYKWCCPAACHIAVLLHRDTASCISCELSFRVTTVMS